MNQLAEKNIKELEITNEELIGKFVSEDIVNMETGEIFAEAGQEITEELLAEFELAKINSIPVLVIDNISASPFLRNTLALDKSIDKETALFEIYKILRPGEPPTVESATALFDSLFFLYGVFSYLLHRKFLNYLISFFFNKSNLIELTFKNINFLKMV